MGAISLAMSRSGDYVLPHLGSEPFVEKPPLFFATAALFHAHLSPFLGDLPAIRLSCAFWALGTLISVFLLGRLLLGPEEGLLATAILGTMVGFLDNAHWLRVDAALVFFVCAAICSYAHFFMRSFLACATLGGVLTAGAFLSKGFIGPAFIAMAFFLLFALDLFSGERKLSKVDLIVHSSLSLLAFSLICGLWMLLFRIRAGGELWDLWFWDENVGRFTGQSSHTHHERPPYYYLPVFLYYSLPWSLLSLEALCSAIGEFKGRGFDKRGSFILLFFLFGFLLLSIASTKRPIYFALLLPSIALLIARLFQRELSWRSVFFMRFWLFLSPLAMLGLALYFGSIVALCCLCASVALLRLSFRGREHLASVVVYVSLSLYLASACVLFPAIDEKKSMASGVADFLSEVDKKGARRGVVAWNPSETTLGALYFYSGWKVASFSDGEFLESFFSGESPYWGLLVSSRRLRPDFFERAELLYEAALTERRKLYLFGPRDK